MEDAACWLQGPDGERPAANQDSARQAWIFREQPSLGAGLAQAAAYAEWSDALGRSICPGDTIARPIRATACGKVGSSAPRDPHKASAVQGVVWATTCVA